MASDHGRQLSKVEARALAYRRLREAGAARFPFPSEGRIPNFRGAEEAARRLRGTPAYRRAGALKCNPDAPQLPVRAMALADGKTVYIPAPRLRGAFLRIRPEEVPAGREREAVRLTARGRFGQEVPVERVAVDLVVTGCVAVAPDGSRAGKGEGYGDLEYALLRELGHAAVPVATTVHESQVVRPMAVEPHDISVDLIVTPSGVVETRTAHPKPAGIDWDRLPAEVLAAMPPLAELARRRGRSTPGGGPGRPDGFQGPEGGGEPDGPRGTRGAGRRGGGGARAGRAAVSPSDEPWEDRRLPEVVAPGLRLLFVGINPGRATALAGHHFAGPGNHFWRLLHEAALTPRRLAPSEDGLLLALGLGVTNLVPRPSRGEQDLPWDELAAGGGALRRRVAELRPAAVALLGKQVYRAYAGLSRSAAVAWGVQPRQTVAGVAEAAAPNPSARSTVPYAQRLDLFRQLAALASGGDVPGGAG